MICRAEEARVNGALVKTLSKKYRDAITELGLDAARFHDPYQADGKSYRQRVEECFPNDGTYPVTSEQDFLVLFRSKFVKQKIQLTPVKPPPIPQPVKCGCGDGCGGLDALINSTIQIWQCEPDPLARSLNGLPELRHVRFQKWLSMSQPDVLERLTRPATFAQTDEFLFLVANFGGDPWQNRIRCDNGLLLGPLLSDLK
jgi:hypothetical protein